MNNDKDNLRKLAGDHPFTISIDDGYCEWSYQYRLTSAVGIGILSRMIAKKLELPEPNGNLRRGTHQPSTLTPVPLDREAMGKAIARGIMEAGDAPNNPCHRISFKCGRYPHNEIDNGGLCESALDKTIQGILANSSLLPRDGGVCEYSIDGLFTKTKCGFAFKTPTDPFLEHHVHWKFCPFCSKQIQAAQKEVK